MAKLNPTPPTHFVERFDAFGTKYVHKVRLFDIKSDQDYDKDQEEEEELIS
ncbi:unnamed protein product [Sphenostylis stenocarpa]|uniref:Uncharacterized protein n=1 Tax=Sphenostylis stenocarpa TaxID=92480 RepID=A0AA86VW22_9FABA|nr:unnamed protein product [Sphenostylis stenocarpa]